MRVRRTMAALAVAAEQHQQGEEKKRHTLQHDAPLHELLRALRVVAARHIDNAKPERAQRAQRGEQDQDGKYIVHPPYIAPRAGAAQRRPGFPSSDQPARRSRAASTAPPISRVPTGRLPACMMSRVRRPLSRALRTARSRRSAESGSSSDRRKAKARLWMAPSGLATPWPAMSGAAPCTGS